MKTARFKEGDRIIYDSGYDYEIGYYVKENEYNNFGGHIVDISSIWQSRMNIHHSQLFEYSDDLINKLTEKYGYEKRFSEVF